MSSDLSSVVKQPMDMTMVESKANSGVYSFEQVFDDLCLMMDNAFSSFPRESRQSQDAVALQRVLIRRYTELKGQRLFHCGACMHSKLFVCLFFKGSEIPVPDVTEQVQKILRSILSQSLSSKVRG